MAKILVINGHGAKLGKQVQVNEKPGIITPGNAENSYVVSFDNMQRHLEEMTAKNKIWPIEDGNGQAMQWHRYHETTVDDVAISPLQAHFTFSRFASDVINKKTKWENLTAPAHDVMARGALAVKMPPSNKIIILEGTKLQDYLKKAAAQTNIGTPIFFCDKELGKVKPMGDTTLSEIYDSIALIDEFKAGADIIVATCSPAKSNATKQVIVQTYQPATEIEKTQFVDICPPKKVTTISKPVVPVASQKKAKLIMNEEIQRKAELLLSTQKLNGVKIIPRVENYKPGDALHNAQQPLQSIQFEFLSIQDRDRFVEYMTKLNKEQALTYIGTGFANQPIVQVAPGFIASFVSPVITTFFKHQTSTTTPSKTTNSIPENLSQQQYDAIRKQIDTLQNEINSCWPYPNKNLKALKVEALEKLIGYANTQTLENAVACIKLEYPKVTQGIVSKRTAKLLDSLVKNATEVIQNLSI